MRPILRLRVFVLLCSCLVLLWTGCTSADEESGIGRSPDGTLRLGNLESTNTVTRAVNPGQRSLVLNSFKGTVDLTGTADPTADLSITRRGFGDRVEVANNAASDIEITEAGTSESYTFTFKADAPERSRADITGTVPSRTPVRIEQTAGTVSLRQLAGPITVRQQNGPVRVAGATADVEVVVDNGDLDVRLARLGPDARVQLRTKNGDVTLALPTTASTGIDLTTQSGDVRVEGLDLLDQELRPRGAGVRYSAQLGSGDGRVTVDVDNGTIRLLATSDALAAPPTPDAPPPDTSGTTIDTVGSGAVSPDTTGPAGADTAGIDMAPPDTAADDTAAADTAATRPDTARPERPSTDTTRVPGDDPDAASGPAEADTTSADPAPADTTSGGGR